MNKLTYFILTIALTISVSTWAQPIEIKSGLNKLTVDNKAYEDYLKKISYATPILLPESSTDLEKLNKYIGKRVTLLGFVKYFSTKSQVSTGYLFKSIQISPDINKQQEPTNIMFATSERFTYKPFEVYQVTGVMKATASDSLASFVINADFAEPQGIFSKAINEPNMQQIVKKTPVFDWAWLDSNFNTEYSGNASASMEIPTNMKNLEGKTIKIRAWLHDTNASSKNGIRVMSSKHPAADSCQHCDDKPADMSNLATIMFRNKMPDNLRGGFFVGKLTLNSKDKWAKFRVFTLEDALLVSPMSYSEQMAISPEITGKN